MTIPMVEVPCFLVVWSCLFIDSRALVKNPRNSWPNGIIYYNVAPELPERMRKSVEYAIRYMNNASCAQWVQRYPLDYHITDYVSFQYYYHEPNDEPGCEATTGLAHDQQVIHLGPVCLARRDPVKRHSVVMHEMMHTMGLYHEHQRPNRDCYITVVSYFDREYADEYGIKDPTNYFSDWPYDFESIMHSPETTFLYPYDHKQKMSREDGTLSKYDVERLQFLYCAEPSYCSAPGGKQKCIEIERKEKNNQHCKN